MNGKTRVALFGTREADATYACFAGVLAYRQRAPHWQIVRSGNSPILSFDAIDLQQVDGVIGFLRDRDRADALHRAGVAVVNISAAVEDIPAMRIASDDEAIGRIGAAHLLERGFTQFGFFGYSDTWFSERRARGYADTIAQVAGVECRRLDVALDRLDENRPRLSKWLAQLPTPIAIMTANDILGLDVIDTAVELGLRVPEDLAVLGVDNERWLTQIGATPMSSVEPDWRQIGFQAAGQLDALVAGAPAPEPLWIPPLGVVARQSTNIMVTHDPLVRQALRHIQQHCESGIRPSDVAGAVGVSRRSLELHFKHAIGQTLQNAILRAQIERAKQLLSDSNHTMYVIANRCGFSRPDRFFIVFKRLSGMTPGEYRRRMNLLHD